MDAQSVALWLVIVCNFALAAGAILSDRRRSRRLRRELLKAIRRADGLDDGSELKARVRAFRIRTGRAVR